MSHVYPHCSTAFVVHIHLQGDSQLPAVLSTLVGLNVQPAPVSTATQTPSPVAPPADYTPGRPWGLQRLEALHRISWPPQHRILTTIATASINDTVATRQQLLTALTVDVNQPQTTKNLAGVLAWISRYAFTVTGYKKGPYTEKDLGPAYADGERHTYAMDKSDAQTWLEVVARKK